jgi:hypothetical protein
MQPPPIQEATKIPLLALDEYQDARSYGENPHDEVHVLEIHTKGLLQADQD